MAGLQELKVKGPIQWQNDRLALGREQVLSEKAGGIEDTIDGVEYLFPENADAKKSVPQRVALVVKEGGGFKTLQFIDRSIGFTNMALERNGKQLPAGVVGLGKGAAHCWHFLSIPGAVVASAKAAESIQKAMDKDLDTFPPEWRSRKTQDAFQDALGAGTMLCAAGMTLSPFFAPLAKIVDRLKLTADVCDGGDNLLGATSTVSDWRRALDLSEKATTPETRNGFVHFARSKLLQLAKIICSIVGFVFAMVALVAGALVVPPIVALAVSLAGTIFALWSTYYDKSMDHSFKFFDKKHHITPVVV